VLVSIAAPAEVETTAEAEDAQDEDEDGLWVALPVNDRIDFVVHIEETEVVSKHVEESMPDHQFPVGRDQLDVSEIDVHPSHQQWSCVKDGHVCNHEVGFEVPY